VEGLGQRAGGVEGLCAPGDDNKGERGDASREAHGSVTMPLDTARKRAG
jgi:hypothetical protein